MTTSAANIKAIVIDPTARTIVETELATWSNPDRFYGTQVVLKDLYALIGCEIVDMFYLPGGTNQAVVDGKSLLSETPPEHFWQYGPNCEATAGIGVITGHDAMKDDWRSTTLSLEEVRNAVKFTHCIAPGMKVETTEDGPVHAHATLVAPIVDERRVKPSGGSLPVLPGGSPR